MGLNASAGAGQDTAGGGLIPNGQLAFCVIAKAELTTGKSGKRYVAMEMVVEPGQPFERCHLWHNLMDFTDPNHKEVTKTISLASLSRILEVGNGANPNNPAAYEIPNWEALVGMRCAVKVGIEKGTQGYADKNSVQFITMNPDSSTSKDYALLQAGTFNKTETGAAAPAQQSMGFGQQQPAQTQAPAQSSPFGQQQQADNPSPNPANPSGGQPNSGGWLGGG